MKHSIVIDYFIAIFHMELNFHFLIDDLKDKNIKNFNSIFYDI